jgi:DNA-binding transcriptional ArsR family regulator
LPHRALRAIANERRIQILAWLRSPREPFPPRFDGDLVRDGVCGVRLAEKLRISHRTLSEHMKILSQAGLVHAKRIKQWTFYRRDEVQIKAVKDRILKRL